MSQGSFLAAIADDPTELDLRLDFADWLQRKGDLMRAAWIRWSSRFGDQQFPLDQQQPLWSTRSSKDFPYAFSGNALVLKLLRPQLWDFFAQCRPDYWNKIPGVRQDPYFGRIIFTVMSPPNRNMDEFDWVTPTRRLGKAGWLADASRDGWLEGIDLPLHDSAQA